MDGSGSLNFRGAFLLRFLDDGALREGVVRVPVSLRESIDDFLYFGSLKIANLKARQVWVRLGQRNLLGRGLWLRLSSFGRRHYQDRLLLWLLGGQICDLARWLWRRLLSDRRGRLLHFGWLHICSELIRLLLQWAQLENIFVTLSNTRFHRLCLGLGCVGFSQIGQSADLVGVLLFILLLLLLDLKVKQSQSLLVFFSLAELGADRGVEFRFELLLEAEQLEQVGVDDLALLLGGVSLEQPLNEIHLLREGHLRVQSFSVPVLLHFSRVI